MTGVLAFVAYPVALALFCGAAFLAVEIAASFLTKPAPPEPALHARRGRVAVVIPAHDEGAGIARTIAAVRAGLSPDDRLLVVADNCSDDTASVARATGADVVERTDAARRGKGFALQFGVDRLKADPPDVVIIVDADCTPVGDALDRIARGALATGRPVQALYLMDAPAAAGAKASVSAFAWLVMNRVRMAGLEALAGFSRLTGSGMAFPWALIRDIDLASGEIVEDLGLTLALLDKGSPPLLDLGALVRSELARSDEGAATQRARWEHGSLRMARRKAPALFLRGLAGDRRALAMALDLATPPLTLFAALIAAGLAGTGILALFGAPGPFVVSLAAASLFAASLTLAWAAYGRAILPPSTLAGLLPYLAGKLRVYGRSGRRSAAQWTRTDRGDSR